MYVWGQEDRRSLVGPDNTGRDCVYRSQVTLAQVLVKLPRLCAGGGGEPWKIKS